MKKFLVKSCKPFTVSPYGSEGCPWRLVEYCVHPHGSSPMSRLDESVPSWCPLEDAKEADDAERGEQEAAV